MKTSEKDALGIDLSIIRDDDQKRIAEPCFNTQN